MVSLYPKKSAFINNLSLFYCNLSASFHSYIVQSLEIFLTICNCTLLEIISRDLATVNTTKFAPDLITLGNFKEHLWLILHFQIDISDVTVMLQALFLKYTYVLQK